MGLVQASWLRWKITGDAQQEHVNVARHLNEVSHQKLETQTKRPQPVGTLWRCLSGCAVFHCIGDAGRWDVVPWSDDSP